MGLIASKSPAITSDDSSLGSRRRQPRRRLPPTPSPWTSGELVESSSDDNVDWTSAPRRAKSKAAVSGQRRSMLRKLLGRLSQKINPHVQLLQGRCHDDVSTPGAFSSAMTLSAAVNCHKQRACSRHHDPRPTLSIRNSLQSCAMISESTTSTTTTNNNCDRPCVPNNVNQVDVFDVITSRQIRIPPAIPR